MDSDDESPLDDAPFDPRVEGGPHPSSREETTGTRKRGCCCCCEEEGAMVKMREMGGAPGMAAEETPR